MFRPGELAACNGNNTCYRVIERRAALEPGVFNIVAIPTWPEATDADIVNFREEHFFRPSIQAKDPLLEMRKRYQDQETDGLPYVQARDLFEKLGSLPFEWNGHFKNGEDFWADVPAEAKEANRRQLFSYFRAMGVPRHLYILLLGQTESPITIGDFPRLKCPNCDLDLSLESDGETSRIKQPCPHPEGLNVTEFEINVPSGKFVVANDLRDLFPVSADHDINRTVGCHLTTLDYAAGGMAHGYVGNSCPGLYRGLKENTFVIANEGSGKSFDKKTYVETELNPPPTFEAGRMLTSICTDLWWYSICDEAEFNKRCAWKGLDPKAAIRSYSCKKVKIKPGVYRFRHNNVREDYASGLPEYYTQIEWVREPDPVQDLLSDYTEQPEPTAAQFLLQSIRNYPTLYSDGKKWEDLSEVERPRALARAASHLLCCGGNGIDWHERGFPLGKIDSDLPVLSEMPLFIFREHWSSLNREYTPMGQVCGHKCNIRDVETMTPSFVQLSLNVLASILSYGVEPREHDGKRFVTAARKTLTTAFEMYQDLRSTFPTVQPPDVEFDVWVSDPERVRVWIRNFEFGDGLWWRYKEDGSVEHEHKPQNV